MIAVFLLYVRGVFTIAAFIAAVADHYTEDNDEELQWVDQRIDELTNGTRSTASEDPDMEAQRRAALERLYRVRRRLVGET